MHVIAAKAVALKEALSVDFKIYAQSVIDNARALSSKLRERGFGVVSGGTDSHLLLVDLRTKNVTGNVAEQLLEKAGLTCNKNAVPFDPQPPMITSGIRLGTPAGTTRGFGILEFEQIGDYIADLIESANTPELLLQAQTRIRRQVLQLCERFPIYKDLS